MSGIYSTLIEAPELVRLTGSENVVVLDCRFSLADTEQGRTDYHKAHIPGAQYAHLDHDLSSAIISGQSGRHPLPSPDEFIDRLRSWGINQDSQIVFYDDASGAIAARAWWLCRWLGIESCAVLNGGYRIWQKLDLPISADRPVRQKGNVSRRTSQVIAIDASQVLEPDRLLVDARDPERYAGDHEPLDPVGGHIPGAINLPFAGNLDADHKFLAQETLRQRFEPLFAPAKGKAAKVITHYCGSGVTAAHNILAMEYAGYPATDLYAGSWSEWVQDTNRPVAASSRSQS